MIIKKNLRSIYIICVLIMLMGAFAGCQKKGGDIAGTSKQEDVSGDDSAEEQADEDLLDDGADGETKTDGEEITLLVAAAASLTDVSKEIADLYKEIAPNVTLTFTYGSSGALKTQIEEGAPVDIFLSAAQKQMDELTKDNYIESDTRVSLLENRVVLIVPAGNESNLTSFQDIAEDRVKIPAIGDPASVPVGQYTEQILTNIGIWDAVKEKANYGTDVRQVLTWVETGEADCGIVYATDAAITDKVEVISEAPEGSSDPVIYPAAVLSRSEYKEEAISFIEFMKGEEAGAVFESFGFTRCE